MTKGCYVSNFLTTPKAMKTDRSEKPQYNTLPN